MMKTYAKPMILANDELAEGVYAASGDDCWTDLSCTQGQTDRPTETSFRVGGYHNPGHSTNGFTALVKFTSNISGAHCEGDRGTAEVVGTDSVQVSIPSWHDGTGDGKHWADVLLWVNHANGVRPDTRSITLVKCNK